jgi:hypothetical protein
MLAAAYLEAEDEADAAIGYPELYAAYRAYAAELLDQMVAAHLADRANDPLTITAGDAA